MQNSLVSIYRKSHVTALEFCEKYLLIGEGHAVEIFDTTNLSCVQQIQVFQNCNIHGIVTESSVSNAKYLAIFGGRSLVIGEFFNNGWVKLCSNVQCLEDWIWDVHWIHTEQNSSQRKDMLAVAMAHNSVVLWDWINSQILLKAECSDKCILYSSNLIGNCWQNLVLTAGTVFKEVIVWAPSDNHEARAKPLHRLQGHEGVIFSVTYNVDQRKLVTTSDDRSVIVWKFCSIFNESHQLEEQNMTLEEWKTGHFELLCKYCGHEARVWTASLLPTSVLSVGEDSTICFWDFDGRLIRREKCHNEGSISSLAVDSSYVLAATGGSDGGVILWHLPELTTRSSSTIIHLSEIIGEMDYPRNVGLLMISGVPTVIVITNKGALLFYSTKDGSWKLLLEDEEFQSYSICTCSPCRKILIVGCITGNAYVLQFSDNGDLIGKSKVSLHDGKIHSILWISKESNYILSCGAQGEMIIFKLQSCDQKLYLDKQGIFTLPISKQRWVSAGVLIEHEDLVVGDRDGSIHFYRENMPCKTFQHIHGKNGVTDIEEHAQLIYSAGRDGRVLVFKLANHILECLHSLKITSDMQWIGKICFLNKEMILMGFHTTNFVVWSSLLGRSTMEVSCGGGHRSWDFTFDGSYQATFTCIRKNEILFASRNLLNTMQKSVVKKGFWGRALCCIHLLNMLENNKEKQAIFAAGGEDNGVLILKFRYGNTQSHSSIDLLHTLHGHISSVRAINSVQIGTTVNNYLLASVGGRSQLILWKIGVENDSVTTTELANHQLVSRENLQHRHSKMKNLKALPDPQTRYLDVCIWKCSTNNIYAIGVACSDATLKFFYFCHSTQQLNLLQIISCGKNCYLQVSLIQTYGQIMILAAATDGFVRLFSSGSSEDNDKYGHNELVFKEAHVENKSDSEVVHSKPVLEKQLHQSGINALCSYKITDCRNVLFTGGDDNAIVASVIIADADLVVDIKSFSCSTAHTAQITGISVLSKNRFLTSSIDQRIHLWTWDLNREINTITFQITNSVISCIPDIAHLEVLKREESIAVVCGEGLEFFVVPK